MMLSKIKIKYLIPLVIAGVFLPLGLALLYLMYDEAVESIQGTARHLASEHTTQISLRLGEQGVSNNILNIQHVLAVAGSRDHVRHLSVLDEKGLVLASTRLAWIGKYASDIWVGFQPEIMREVLNGSHVKVVSQTKVSLAVYHEASIETALNGKIRAEMPVVIVGEYDFKQAYAELQESLWQQALFYLITLDLAILLITWLLGRLVSRPVEDLEHFVSAIQHGKHDVFLAHSGSVEMVSLAEKLQQMNQQILQTKAERDASYSMLRSHLDAVPDLIFFKDKRGVYVGCNQAYCDFVEKPSVEAVVGCTDFDLFEEEVAQKLKQRDMQVLEAGEQVRHQECIVYPNGKKVMLDTLKDVMSNEKGEVVGLLGVSRDISEEHQLETAIQSLVDSTSGKLGDEFFTAAVHNMYQWTNADVMILSELVEPTRAQALAMIVDGKEVSDYSYDLAHTPCEEITTAGFCGYPEGVANLFPKDQDLIDLNAESYVGTPIRNKDGKAVGIFCALSKNPHHFASSVENVFKVIAARAGAEIERKNLEEQLLQAQKMEAVGTLAGGIAHDFNNTLAGITANIYLAKREVKALPKVVSRLEGIERMAFHAGEMIQQLLTFSRKDIMSMKPINLSLFLQELIQVYQVALPESIQFTQQVVDSTMEINADVKQLQQLVMNLLNNAKDAVEGVAQPEITLSLARFEANDAFLQQHDMNARTFACIRVLDNGAGIPDENLPHIFEPFFTTKGNGQGTGLGLSMVYGCMQSHQGVVVIDSEVGVGTTVHCYFPIVDEEHKENMRALEAGIERGFGEKVLLVDDNVDLQEIGQSILEDLGYVVVVASNGEEAIERFQENQDVDLIMMDMVMPKMGGLDAAKHIRAIDKDAKIIFLTGYDASQELNKHGQASEVVMLKPFQVDKLSQMIRQVLNGEAV